MAEHYFVAVYDDEKNTWKVDNEVAGHAFPDGTTYDEGAGWFINPYGKMTPKEITNAYDQAAGDLAAMLALGSFVRSKVGA